MSCNFVKTVLFDLYKAQPAGNSKFHGGGEYIKCIYKELLDNYLDKCRIIVFFDDNRFLDDWILKSFETYNIKACSVHGMDDIQKVIASEDYDVFYTGVPYDYGSLDYRNGIVKRGTIHGLRRVENPIDRYEYLYETDFLKRIKSFFKPYFKKYIFKKYWKSMRICIDYLDDIATVSNHSKYALKCFYPDINKNIEVYYTPFKYSHTVTSGKPIVNGKYMLMLGGNRSEKNSYRALMAIDELYSSGQILDMKTVVVGKLPKEIIGRLRFKDKIIEFDYVESDELENLYKNCELFLFLSINEGFGMPPIEAMQYKKTSIVSAVCSMPEIYGDAVYYANPYDINEIKNRILMASENKKSEEVINRRVNYIRKMQSDALKGICDFIVR